MSKELESFVIVKNTLIEYPDDSVIYEVQNKSLGIIEKGLKALEIIKEKEVNVHFLLVCMDDFSHNDEWGREEYNKQEGSYWHTANALTQEEYNLLKEVLNDGN